jgi:hypothetical protein
VVTERRELLRGETASPAELLARLLASRRDLLLVEEFVVNESGEHRFPVEYKCHTFGQEIAAIQVVERTGASSGTCRYYTGAFEPFADAMDPVLPPGPVRAPPPFLGEMLQLAARLGVALGTYMRIDFFGTAGGCAFNEFSSTPEVEKLLYTPYCNALLDEAWARSFPDAT